MVSTDPEYEKRQSAIRLAQTVAKFLSGTLMRAFYGVKREAFDLLPVLCMNESNEFEPHLASDCTYALACLSQVDYVFVCTLKPEPIFATII